MITVIIILFILGWIFELVQLSFIHFFSVPDLTEQLIGATGPSHSFERDHNILAAELAGLEFDLFITYNCE